MSVGTWEPGGGSEQSAIVIDGDLLQLFLSLPREAVSQNDLQEAGIADKNAVMKLGHDAWQIADVCTSEELSHLIRVFTLVEAVPGWDAGAKSPVIALVKILKARGEFDAELRKWVKANTDNRYLPYGSAL